MRRERPNVFTIIHNKSWREYGDNHQTKKKGISPISNRTLAFSILLITFCIFGLYFGVLFANKSK